MENNEIKSKRMQNFIRRNVEEQYKKCDGILAVSGIFDYRQLAENGINLRMLNEGITAYKQEMYDKFLGRKIKVSYNMEKDVAEFIANIIGRDELINLHFNNDYEGIRGKFKEKTGNELNELVKILNSKSIVKTILFGTIYTRKIGMRIKTFMEDSRRGVDIISKKNADFVPKFDIDHTEIKKFIEDAENKQTYMMQEKDKNGIEY